MSTGEDCSRVWFGRSVPVRHAQLSRLYGNRADSSRSVATPVWHSKSKFLRHDESMLLIRLAAVRPGAQ